MASSPQFCTQADLERALGGAVQLVQLHDRGADGNADPASVTDILDYGSNELASYIQRLVDVATIATPYPRILVLKAADVCAYHAWARGSRNEAIPDTIREKYEAAIRWANDVGEGRATLAIAPQ